METLEKMGVDDFIASGGTADQLWAAARPADEVIAEWSEGKLKYGFTHWGSAQLLRDALGDDFVWCPKAKWYGWDDDSGIWVQPADHLLLEAGVRELERQARNAVRAAANMGDEGLQKKAARYLDTVQDISGITGAMKMLAPLLAGSYEQFDKHTDKLAVANGTLIFDGEDVRLEPHRREDYITKKSPVVYDETAECPFWMSTLEAFVPNTEIRAFLQRLAGSLLVGVGVREQRIPFFFGEGGCGKSTFAEGMATILGEEYAVSIDPATIRSAQRSGSSPSPDLFALRGARVVIAEEAEDQEAAKYNKIDVGMIKRWSAGNDSTKIVARPLRGDVVKFTPTFTLILVANNAPQFSDTSDGIWRRLLVIPFNTKMPDEKKMDAKEVGARLKAEASGILNWAIEGYKQWKANGLNPPQEVLLAGKELRSSQDHIGNFIDETAVRDENGFVSVEELHTAYMDWKGRDKEIPEYSRRAFGMEMKRRWGDTQVRKVDGRSKRGWSGWSLGGSDEQDQVTEERSSYRTSSRFCNRESAGQSTKGSPVTEVTELFEVELTREEKNVTLVQDLIQKSSVTGVQDLKKTPLTSEDAVTEDRGQFCNPILGLPPTVDFSTGQPSTDDAPWRRLYRDKKVGK